ncbi:MAG TPA: serine hydrolase domain-containing protein [Ornithinibacter sp.]|nr:serine hydrolase domain-containing protein [Ornithinibacter sp.]
MSDLVTPDDAHLAARAAHHLGGRHDRFLAVAVSGGHGRTAHVGLEAGADVEIGSVSKGVTGMAFADSRSRGETTDSTCLGDLLPLGGSPAARVTLGELATHRSGLPRLARGTASVRSTVDLWRHGTNPYGESLDELLVATRATRVGRKRARYSNLGFMLLGHAVAAAAGTTYAGLLRERLADPLQLVSTTAPAGPADLGPGAVIGRSRGGRAMAPWTGEALGPAGGIRSTADDLARLVAGLLDGSAPGTAALDPVARLSGGVRIGAAWLVLERRGAVVTWHNGGTGGFRSIVALDRAAGVGVALVSATARSVDRAGFDLLEEYVAAGPGPGVVADG